MGRRYADHRSDAHKSAPKLSPFIRRSLVHVLILASLITAILFGWMVRYSFAASLFAAFSRRQFCKGGQVHLECNPKAALSNLSDERVKIGPSAEKTSLKYM